MDTCLRPVPRRGSVSVWRRAQAAAGYAVTALVLFAAVASCESPTPTAPDQNVETAPEANPLEPMPQPEQSLVGTWRGQTTAIGLGVVSDETIFGGDGSYSELTVSQVPGTQILATGKYSIDISQHVIAVSHVRTCTLDACPDPRFQREYIVLQYTWIDADTLRLQYLGCLNYDPAHCDPVTFSRVR